MLKPQTTPYHNPQHLIPQIKTCKTIQQLKTIHAIFIKTNKANDPTVSTELLKLSATSEFRDPIYALKLFHKMPQPNCFA